MRILARYYCGSIRDLSPEQRQRQFELAKEVIRRKARPSDGSLF